MKCLETASQMLMFLKEGKISAIELAKAHRERYLKCNSSLNAIISPDYEHALETARESDQRRSTGRAGQLEGLPVTVKDAIHVAGLPTTGGGLIAPSEAIQRQDAPTVARLRLAGGVILGKTNTPPGCGDWQSANERFGRTNNPWNVELTSGGSTGGAAAVAAGLSPLEIGSDIGGSIRIPAAFCGIYGHKPSTGVLPHSGHFPGGHTANTANLMGVQGPLARSAADLALAMEVLAGPDTLDAKAWRLELPPARHQRLSDFRIGLLSLPNWAPVDSDIMATQLNLQEQLAAHGTQIISVGTEAFGDWKKYYCEYLSLLQCIMSAGLPREKLTRAAEKLRGYGNEFYDAIASGLTADAGRMQQLLVRAEGQKARWETVFRNVDVILAPVTLVNAFPHNDLYFYDRTLTVNGTDVPYPLLSFLPSIATFAGLPATAFPAGRSSTGLPIGLQVLGPYLEDNTTIRFAQLVERTFGGYQPPPTFC